MKIIKQNYNKSTIKSIIRILCTIFLLLYIIYLLYLVFFSSYYGRAFSHRSINFVPFKTIIAFTDLSTHSLNAIITNLLGNIAAFVPMGFLIPITFNIRNNRFIKVFIVVLFATICIELSQYIMRVGTCDIDDVILNVLGGMVGYVIFFLWDRIIKI